jgi:hypothetical protein
MSANSEKLARARAKAARQKTIIKTLEAKVRREESAEARKLETRQKILLGSWLLDSLREDHDATPARKHRIGEMILRRATEYRDYVVMKDLYRELTDNDLPEPPKPERVRSEAIQPSADSLPVGEAFADGAASLSEVASNAAEEPVDRL